MVKKLLNVDGLCEGVYSEEFITLNADEMSERDWINFSTFAKLDDFSEEFYHKFRYQISWKEWIDGNENITTEFHHKYQVYMKSRGWYKEGGLLHREEGPALIRDNGDMLWFLNGICQRDFGPAFITSDGTCCWYKDGDLHRESGPALIYPDGSYKFYLEGISYEPQEHYARVEEIQRKRRLKAQSNSEIKTTST